MFISPMIKNTRAYIPKKICDPAILNDQSLHLIFFHLSIDNLEDAISLLKQIGADSKIYRIL